MARRALVEILGDASGFIQSTRKSAAAAESLSGDLKKLSVNARASAEAQVAASVKKTARLRSESAAYREIAFAAQRGSREQVAASNLAAAADARLARSMGVTAHEANRLRSSASGVEHDVGRATRGALAGSGIFRGLGRSLAFASGGFLAFASAGQFVRKSLDAAEASGKAFRSVGAQARATGTDVGQARGDVGKLSVPAANLGFNKADVAQGFTVLLRGSGSAKKAISEMAAAEDVARAKGMSLSQGALIVNRALIGTGNSARSLGIHFPKAATQAEKLAIILQRFRGQAAANTTETDRFNATLFNTESIIGDGLLPVLNKYLAAGTAWLTQMNQSGRLQKDVATAAHDVGVAVHIGVDAFKAAETVIHGVDRVTGSLENTLKDLAAIWLILKARMAINWAATVLGMEATGAAAMAAGSKVSALRASLTGLNGYVAAATILIIERHQIVKAVSKAVNDANAGGPGDLLPVRKNGKWVDAATGKPVQDQAYWNAHPPVSRGGGTAATVNRSAGFSGAGSDVPSAANGKTGYTLGGQFNLLQLKLANAQVSNNTAAQRAILVQEEKITLKLRDQAKTLAKRTELTQQAASIEDQIRSLDAQKTSAAKKTAKDAAKKANQDALGGVPLPLQLAQAKADALAAGQGASDLTKGQVAAREAIRNAEYKAIRSHKLSMQGLIDAWTEIGSINQELQSQTGKGVVGSYHHASTTALTAGLGLARGVRVALEERLAQSAAHRGYVPSGPAAQGQVIQIGHVDVHGVQNVDALYSELEKTARRRGQRRGTR